jgi:glycosyltransferase involved in cell wall biosynthesis
MLDKDFWYAYVNDYIKRCRINTIFICGASYIYPYLSRLREAFPDIKIVDQLFNDSPMGHMENNRRFSDFIDLTIVPAEKIRLSMLSRFGGEPARVHSVYHGADLERFDPRGINEAEARRKFDLPEGKRIILYVGRLSEEKNPSLFVDLANAFRDERSWHFVMRGNGPLREMIEGRARGLRLRNLTILGVMEAGDMPFLYGAADLLVITSDVEGIPLTVFEAMAMNVPVGAADVGGISEVIEEGKNGYLFQKGDKVGMVKNVRQAMDTTFGNVRETIEGRYDLKKVLENYLGFFDKKRT